MAERTFLEDPARPGLLVAVFHRAEGLAAWPLSEVAMVREEWEGRLEATSADGEVAHRPGPLGPFRAGGLVEAAPGVLVHPAHVRREGDEVAVPGGWRLRAGALPHSEPVPADPDAVVAQGGPASGRDVLREVGEEVDGPSEQEDRVCRRAGGAVSRAKHRRRGSRKGPPAFNW